MKTFLWDLDDVLIVAHAATEADAREEVRKKFQAISYPVEAICGFETTSPKVLDGPYATWRWS